MGGVAAATAVPAALWMAPAARGGDGSSKGGGGGTGTASSAAVADPMFLWSRRSPSERGLALLSTKPTRG